MSDQPGALGGYQLERQLAEGLWVGVRGGRRFAVRMVNGPVDAPALGRVQPFCAARVVEVGPGYVVSELVEGPSLLSVVASAGVRGGEELDRVAARTLTALGAIHQAGLVHGSFHPGSVLLGPDGAVVTDFGVARGGVPAYASPEQVAADRFTPAGDLFAWAATMAYAANGRPPYGDGEPAAIFQRILQAEPELGQLSGALRNVVAACLAKDPATRPTAQVAQQLLVSGVPSAPSSGAFKQPPAKPPAPRKQRDLRVPIAAGVAAVLVVGAAVAWAVLRPKEAPKAAVLAGNEQPTTPSAAPTPSVMKTKKRHTPKPTGTQNVVLPPQQQITVTVSKSPHAKKSTDKPTVQPTGKPTVTPTPTRTPEPAPSDPPKTEQPQPQPQVQSQRLVNVASGRCLVVRDNEKRAGKEVAQYECNQFPQQQWSLQGGSVVNKGTGMCLAIGNGEKKAGKYVIQWPCLNSPAQKWSYDGMQRLRNQATGMCLAIAHGEATLGKYAIQWPCKTTGEQRWRAS